MAFSGHYDCVGAGEPVLCLTGFASGNWIFSRLLEPMCHRYRFILPDNRGMGRSPPVDVGYTLDDLADDALGLMDDLGIERFAVIGLSMGGFIAQLLALKAPGRVRAMVLLCTTSGGPDYRQTFPSLTQQQIRAIYALDPLARVTAALSENLCPLLKTAFPEVYAYVVSRRVADPADPEQVMYQFFAVERFMDRPLPLDRVTCPVLILTADQDLLVPEANALRLARDLPHARVVKVTGADHLFFLEKVSETTAAIEDFLGGR
ncbi:MAG: AB hydrolase-1 protein [Magnetococcales bacterium]|nr:AB hydrolase-1 protein [Magnetococcales bacterium]HIJ83003.1 alpha/beta fold hydrolase [Magnetococcales bacterium]